MTTFADLIEETRQHLLTGHPERINVLDADINNSVTAVPLTYENKGISEGSTIVIDLEEMHVVSITTTGGDVTLTVIRGFNGSTKVAHTAAALVYVNPQFSSFRIAKAVNQGIDNLSAEGLFRILSTTLTANSTLNGYDLGALPYLMSVWKVRYSTVGSSLSWPELRPTDYHIDPIADTTSFPSGRALFLNEGILSGRSIRVSYRAKFVNLVNTTDDVLTVSGLHTEAHDLPPLYAAIRMLAGREIKRSFLNRQPEPRRQEEVPPGAANQAMQPLLKVFYERLDNEKLRLKRLYPGAVY